MYAFFKNDPKKYLRFWATRNQQNPSYAIDNQSSSTHTSYYNTYKQYIGSEYLVSIDGFIKLPKWEHSDVIPLHLDQEKPHSWVITTKLVIRALEICELGVGIQGGT